MLLQVENKSRKPLMLCSLLFTTALWLLVQSPCPTQSLFMATVMFYLLARHLSGLFYSTFKTEALAFIFKVSESSKVRQFQYVKDPQINLLSQSDLQLRGTQLRIVRAPLPWQHHFLSIMCYSQTDISQYLVSGDATGCLNMHALMLFLTYIFGS